jgi:hypothetical protein
MYFSNLQDGGLKNQAQEETSTLALLESTTTMLEYL